MGYKSRDDGAELSQQEALVTQQEKKKEVRIDEGGGVYRPHLRPFWHSLWVVCRLLVVAYTGVSLLLSYY